MAGFIFDLDGTLVDTVYSHLLAWQRAFAELGVTIDGSRVHPRIGLTGDLLIQAIGRDVGRRFDAPEVEALKQRHQRQFRGLAVERRPLRGAIELLEHLVDRKIPHGIASSGDRDEIAPSLAALRLRDSTIVVDGGDVRAAKPAPDPLLLCRKKIGVAKEECHVVGDTIWDALAARRAGMLPLGLLTGGRGASELVHAGAGRVFADPAALDDALEELGFGQ